VQETAYFLKGENVEKREKKEEIKIQTARERERDGQ
jgi:hypothetical protein